MFFFEKDFDSFLQNLQTINNSLTTVVMATNAWQPLTRTTQMFCKQIVYKHQILRRFL